MSRPSAMQEVGKMIRSERRVRGLTLEQVSSMTRLPISTIQRIEVTRRTLPPPEDLRPICDALQLDIQDLVGVYYAGRRRPTAAASLQFDSLRLLDR